MRFLHLTLPTPEENLALDEALLSEAERAGSPETLRVWETPIPCVVLGYFCRLEADVNVARCDADGVAIRRRVSGGGTVLIGRGCLNFSLVLDMRRRPALRDVGRSHAQILRHISEAISEKAPGTVHRGISDLCLGERKFSGNAQRRRRDWLLHHGTILYDFDLAQVSRYLREPARQPDYRATRSHGDFITNLSADAPWLIDRLRTAWDAREPLADWPRELTARLVAERYARPEWIRRR
ncbi:MAG: lipoate--protein ligase family protein [Verrucomicrobiae bacterium]|nr:lipoate--protein ligase family protein [Verrucomicrobiae bacterium]